MTLISIGEVGFLQSVDQESGPSNSRNRQQKLTLPGLLSYLHPRQHAFFHEPPRKFASRGNMRTIFIMLDSLNRHFLSSYAENPLAHTPNIERLAKRGVVFDNHYCGSMPCMPARREMYTGRLNFLETPWSPIMPWDDCLQPELRRQKGTYSHMITDHYHYFHAGGENYHTRFNSWEFQRGQESDVWHPLVDDPPQPNFQGKNSRPYWVNRQFMDTEQDEDYPTPQCFERAIEFVDNNHDADNWHLHLEAFDPHEPFACTRKYLDMYNDDWAGDFHFDWPNYAPVAEEADAVEHIRKRYCATLTMADVWLGKLLDRLDELDMWQDTTVVLTTDHGHLLGDHGYWAKNYMFDYQELVHIPLIVCQPGIQPGRRQALTATMDLMPTFMDWFGAEAPAHVHGRSLQHVIEEDSQHHDAILYGYFGKDINLTDGKHTYCRQALPDSTVHHHTLMPVGFADFDGREKLAAAEMGVFLEHAHGVPHLRMAGKSRRHHDAPDFHPLYDVQADPQQQSPIHDEALEARFCEQMRSLLQRYDAPTCQYERMGF